MLLGFLIFKQYPLWKNSYRQQGKVISKPYYFKELSEEMINPKSQNRVYMFWATWCGPCHVQMELIEQAIKNGLVSKVGFYAIS